MNSFDLYWTLLSTISITKNKVRYRLQTNEAFWVEDAWSYWIFLLLASSISKCEGKLDEVRLDESVASLLSPSGCSDSATPETRHSLTRSSIQKMIFIGSDFFRMRKCINRILCLALHNVLFVQYVFLPTEQAETYLKIYVLIYHLTYICPSLFGWKENLIFKETVTFKL